MLGKISKFSVNWSKQPKQNKMNLPGHHLISLTISIIAFALASCSLPKGETPINALLITGGCCHDYDFQKQELTTGISKFAEVDWTIATRRRRCKRLPIKTFRKSLLGS